MLQRDKAHRADIQSLRALAIGLVVAAHAHVPWLKGGYVGVDVFFVLSGFLISGLVLHEVEVTGHFDAWRFYARRVKRLFPALITVLLLTAAAAWLLLGPVQQELDAEAAQPATIWLSNFHFSALSINYFSSSPNRNLFLHTWSLAVEEQFYLVWPWLLLYMYGAWKWHGAPMSKSRLAIGLGIAGAASLALAVYWANTNPEMGFYLMPGRIWEFALGTLVFLLRRSMDMGSFAQLNRWRGRSLLNVGGWLAILVVAVVYPNDLAYPGLWALLPSLGAALVLLDKPEEETNRIFDRIVLRAPVLQFFGDISYSLYLWHWPVLVLGNQIFTQSAATETALVALSIGLACTTYYTVERPLHRARLPKPAKVLIPAALVAAVGFTVMGAWQNAASGLMEIPAQVKIISSMWDAPIIYDQRCDTWIHSAKIRTCTYGPADSHHTIVLFGDSVMGQWFPAFKKIYLRNPSWRLVVLTKSACPASQVSYYYKKIDAPFTVCDVWRQRALDYMAKLHPDVIVLGSARYQFSSAQWVSGTREVLNRLSPVAHSIVIMSPTPQLDFDSIDCLSAKSRWPHWLPQLLDCETPLRLPSKHGILENLTRAAGYYANVHIIDLREAICPNGECRAENGQTVTYRDAIHLTATFARSLAPVLQRSLRLAGILTPLSRLGHHDRTGETAPPGIKLE